MSQVVIHCEQLGKRYQIGPRERYLALRDVLANSFQAPWRLFGSAAPGSSNGRPKHIWALRNVSFEIQEGEVLGIVGRNGAGKTTLLKVLARVTKPTEGHAEVVGRMGSLLEVGTGFHPELTGRENIYLSGAILGMSKREINRKFDEIVAFAEVEQFIDTPLKHYSSGMQMRLAFAVAAHLEPEILLVDEVLAVGDLAFQKKCLGKMGEVARGGRTILFVTHQMNQIRRLCERVFWIDAGGIRAAGPPGEVISAYETFGAGSAKDRQDSDVCFSRWEISGHGNVLRNGARDLTLHFDVRLNECISNGHFGVAILNESDLVVVGWGFDEVGIPRGHQKLILRVPELPLRPGVYTLVCSLFNRGNNLTGGQLVEQWNAVPPLVVDTTPVSHPQDRWCGLLNIPAKLSLKPDS
jgi:lipopolysaccharide transport system ATP-binding protein